MFNKPFVRNFKVSNNIASIPFEELGEATPETYDAEVEQFVAKYGLKSKTWVYPQLIAEVAKWSITRSSGKIDGKHFVKTNCTNLRNKGIYWFLMWDKRALEKQYKATNYCALVPLIMSAFKTMQDIQYSEWDGVQFVINPALLAAVSLELPEYTPEELLAYRAEGLTTKSGKSAGATKSAVTTYGVYGLHEDLPDGRPGLGPLPQLTKMMLLQTWCAHPHNRSKYCILDVNNWDNMPHPLIEEDVAETGRPTLEALW